MEKKKTAILKYLHAKKYIDQHDITIKEFTLDKNVLKGFKDIKNIDNYELPLGHIYYEGDKVWLDTNG